ncbi:hypothetical protein ACP70R_049173 [Stipagrostis hirtigluma subsp. patula]
MQAAIRRGAPPPAGSGPTKQSKEQGKKRKERQGVQQILGAIVYPLQPETGAADDRKGSVLAVDVTLCGLVLQPHYKDLG